MFTLKVERAPNGIYDYHSLEYYATELEEHGIGFEEHKHIRHKCHVYGVVQEILPTTIPDSYECRIYDETMEGIQVRIHTTRQLPTLGPVPSKGDIIRIHRATVGTQVQHT